MPRIFISYRRADSEVVAGRIYDRLVLAFGDGNVFQDVDDIPAGVDFRTYLQNEVAACNVELVIIGKLWANVTDATGRKRLDDPDDFVRIEVEAGLSRQDVLVIPVLVIRADMPAPADLPSSLRELTFRNAIAVRNNPDFNRDMDRLIEQLQRHFESIEPHQLPPLPKRASSRGFLVLGIAVASLLIAVVTLISSNMPKSSRPSNLETQAVLILATTSEARAGSTQTAEATLTLNAIMTRIIASTNSANNTVVAQSWTATPSNTLIPSLIPTDDETATVISLATLNAQATASVPTNTPFPTDTSIPQPSKTPIPTYTFILSVTPPPDLTLVYQAALYERSTLDAQTSPNGAPIIGVIASLQSVNVREASNVASESIQVLVPGTSVEVVGRNGDGSWLKIKMLEGREGWIAASFMRIDPQATLDAILLSPTATFVSGVDAVQGGEGREGNVNSQQGLDVLAYCDNPIFGKPAPSGLNVGATIDVMWSWYTSESDLIQQHLENVIYEVRVDGVLLDNWSLYKTSVRKQNDGNYYVYWFVPYGPLAAGEHKVTYLVSWKAQITDGFDVYGPGTNRPSESGSCTFTVR